jgi:hypothetical protein
MRAEPPLADDPERRLTLRQASQARDDFTQILDDLDLCASRPPTGGFLPDLEADSEASLLRAGPKDPASRIRPILRRLVPISSNASPNCWPLRDAQPVGVLPVEVRICTLARREPIEQALTYPLVHHPERVRDDHRFRFKPLAFLTKPE